MRASMRRARLGAAGLSAGAGPGLFRAALAQEEASHVPVVRIKDIARLESVRDNQLTAWGL